MIFINDILKNIINIIYTEIRKKKNKKKIDFILKKLEDSVMNRIKPYIYTIFGILIILFLVNCFQFFYYIKLHIQLSKLLFVR